MPRLERQAYESLLRHAERCDTDPEYDWDRVPKDRRHAMNAALDLKDAEARIANLLGALKMVIPYMEEAETAGLVGDEGCHWPVEIVRCAIKDEEDKSHAGNSTNHR